MLKYNPPDGSATTPIRIDVSADPTVSAHVAEINRLIPILRLVSAEVEEVQRAIGERIRAIKLAAPCDWEAVVKAQCGISRSRAFELLAIADGTKTAEQTRRASKERQAKRRQNQAAVRDVTDAERKLAEAQTQITQLRTGHARQIDRFKAEIVQLGDAEALRFERDKFRIALDKVSKLLSEARGLTRHYEHNRTDIIAKINRAKNVAETALRAPAVTRITTEVAAAA